MPLNENALNKEHLKIRCYANFPAYNHNTLNSLITKQQ